MKSSKAILVLLAATVLIALSIPAFADLYWESEVVSKSPTGQAQAAKIVKNYYTANASRVETPDQITIMNFDSMVIYTLRPASKTYSELNMKDMSLSPGMPKMDDKEAKKFQDFMQNMMKMEVTPTNETEQVSGYKCRKYIVKQMMSEQQLWVTKDIPGFDEFMKTSAEMEEKIKNSPILKSSNMAGMVSEVDGFPIKTITNIMGATVTNIVKEIKQTQFDPSLFKVPEGYKLQPSQPAFNPSGIKGLPGRKKNAGSTKTEGTSSN